jgi:hypothetical protein
MAEKAKLSDRVSVLDFGAKGDGVSLDTQAIQATIDTCARYSGGTVFFPAGTYLTGTLILKSNITLHLAAQARLLGSTDLKHYTVEDPHLEGDCLIYAIDAENIGLAGEGTIDGQGWAFPCGAEGFNIEDVTFAPSGETFIRPVLLHFVRVRNLTITGLNLKSAPSWLSKYEASKDIKISGVRVDNRANQNNDGFDFIACENVFISNCNMTCGDDAIPIFKSARNFVITNCVISSRWSAFRIGPDSTGVIKDIAVSNCVIYDTYGSAIKIQNVEGGVMENISYDNLVMDNVTGPISLRLAEWLGWRFERKEALPVGKLRNISFSNIRAHVADNSYPLKHEVPSWAGEKHSCINITGLPGHNIEGVTLSNIHITFPGGGTHEEAARRDIPELRDHYPEYHMFGVLPTYGLYARHAQELTLHNVRFDLASPDLRPAVVWDDVADLELSSFRAQGHSDVESLSRLRQTRRAFIHGCRALTDIGTFVRAEGDDCHEVILADNDLHRVKSPIETAEGADSRAFIVQS